ncbi:unnamed protein product [Durusdinium trenchii]|uniref:Uncharacterized protein n=2 Tax=Durusdinium trenchii TaxID=1381693 RepID=A0ABP0PZ92_9DINO
MRCPWSSLLAGAILMAVSTGAWSAWWSWTTWRTWRTYNQSLEARLETVETHLAALEAELGRLAVNKGVTSEPRPERPEGQGALGALAPVLPKSLPRRLSTDKEVPVASEDFDSWKTYITHGHAWWVGYSVSQFGKKSQEEGCEEFGRFSKRMHAPDCEDMSVIENVTKYAMDGNEEQLFSVLEKHPDQDLKDLALASAAFGLPVLRKEEEQSSLSQFGLMYAKEQWHLDSRIEIVRRLFTNGTFGNSSFVDVGFKLAKKEEIQVEPALLRLLTWGTLRRWLVRPCPSPFSGDEQYCAILSLNMEVETAKLGYGRKGVPASVFQYAIDHPEFLDERSSEDRTLLMEASSLHSCAKSPAIDPCNMPFQVVTGLHQQLGVSLTAMDEEGKNAAMLAAQHGALDRANSLQSAILEEEMKKQPWIYHFKFMLSFVLVLHIALALVTLLFHYCSGGWEWWLVRDFLMKTGLLTACNVLIQYLVVPEVLLDPKAMLEVYYNIHMPHSWPIFALLTAIFTVYTIYDLNDAVRREREGYVVPSVQAVNVYQDPKVSILTCMHTFLLSCIFVCVYWNKVVGPVQMNLFTRFCWAFALFVQYYLSSKFRSSPNSSKGFEFGRWAVCLDDQCGNNLWAVLLKKGKLEADGEPAPLLSRPEVLLRFFMDYIANGFFRILILYSLPVYLATSEQASDFALNAFAVTFISEIDNLSEPAEYQIEGYKSLESGKREIK